MLIAEIQDCSLVVAGPLGTTNSDVAGLTAAAVAATRCQAHSESCGKSGKNSAKPRQGRHIAKSRFEISFAAAAALTSFADFTHSSRCGLLRLRRRLNCRVRVPIGRDVTLP